MITVPTIRVDIRWVVIDTGLIYVGKYVMNLLRLLNIHLHAMVVYHGKRKTITIIKDESL